jgi:hypothetical protein
MKSDSVQQVVSGTSLTTETGKRHTFHCLAQSILVTDSTFSQRHEQEYTLQKQSSYKSTHLDVHEEPRIRREQCEQSECMVARKMHYDAE